MPAWLPTAVTSSTTMTKQTRKPASQFRGLKYWFAAGSLAAALLGTQLLAANDQLDTAVALSPTAQQEASVIPAQRQTDTRAVRHEAVHVQTN